MVDYLEECVKSIQEQSIDDYEIILVDDGSSDGCYELCDKIASNDNRTYVYHKENAGLSSARNYGVLKAKGEYIYFLDSDDFVKKGAFSNFKKYIEKYNHPEIISENGMCVYDSKGIRDEEYYTGGDSFGLKGGKEALRLFLTDAPIFSACGKCFSRKMWVDNDMCFTEGTTSEDLDLIYKVFFFAKSVVMTEKSYYVYRTGRDGSITYKTSPKRIRDYFSIFERWESFLTDNECDNDICDGIHHLLGNVYIYYVLSKLDEIGFSKEVMEEAKNNLRYLEYSDGYRLSRVVKVIGFGTFSRCFNFLWWIDIHYRMLFDRNKKQKTIGSKRI